MNGKNLKYFVMGAAIVAVGLGALAVTLPAQFQGGEVLTAAKLNSYFTAIRTAIDALEANGSVSTARIADGAVNAAKTLDEPGGAQAKTTATGSITNSTGYDVLLTREITVPAAGFVMAIGSGEFCVTYGAGGAGWGVAVSINATSVPDATDVAAVIPAAAAGSFFCSAMSTQKIFPVSAGLNTFRFLGSKFFTTNPTVDVNDAVLSLVYFPTAYGTVTP